MNLIFGLFCSFSFYSNKKKIQKNMSAYRTRIVWVEGEHDDHLSTTTAPKKGLNILSRNYLCIRKDSFSQRRNSTSEACSLCPCRRRSSLCSSLCTPSGPSSGTKKSTNFWQIYWCLPTAVWSYLAKFHHFGKIFSLGQYFKGLFTIWQNIEPTLANFVYY